ncbi:MAG: crossover junction endodeoxyribonuclease RuvC [Candidatus Cloacimonetes bacterium]|nr:crossover junction endodeoxyribonuclease RuvC [Candidatus Cloacimonadota bacterium]HNZ06227.1 crossover junction endodeoxyribonuclease RuvC [Candidatus Cloacimonadota bacterium]HOH78366.1 crossover junction endodeoxyribonuclease RuvC [Candidatus Cloacimonadota bacterium]
MVLIGIDPGSRVCGYGLLETQGRVITAAGCDVVDISSYTTLPERLAALFARVEAVLAEFKPEIAVVESMFYHKNVKSMLTLSQARGVILLAFARYGLPVFEYSPREVKKAVVGNGGASKQQVRYMVEQLFKLKGSDKPDDAYDALAIAMCHFNRIRFLS